MTFRRDKLMRLAKAGKLVCVSSYHFDDMYGESRNIEPMPVRVVEKMSEAVEGVVCLTPWHFKSSSGYAYENEKYGVITLYVHSNLNFDFRVIA